MRSTETDFKVDWKSFNDVDRHQVATKSLNGEDVSEEVCKWIYKSS